MRKQIFIWLLLCALCLALLPTAVLADAEEPLPRRPPATEEAPASEEALLAEETSSQEEETALSEAPIPQEETPASQQLRSPEERPASKEPQASEESPASEEAPARDDTNEPAEPIIIPVFDVPGLTETGVNITLVRELDDIISPMPDPAAMSFILF